MRQLQNYLDIAIIFWVLIIFNNKYPIYIKMIGLISRVFTNGPGDRHSILGRVIPKTQKMILDAALLYTQLYKVIIKGKVEHKVKQLYKVMIKGKVEHSREWSSALPYTSV